MDSLLFLEAVIVDRLKCASTGFKHIGGMPNLEEVQSKVAQFTPACWVSWDGDTVVGTSGGGRQSKIKQRWLLFVAVRNVADNAKGAAARCEAGTLLMQVYKALQGFEVGGVAPLVRASAPAPVYAAGLLIAPIAFETEFITSSC